MRENQHEQAISLGKNVLQNEPDHASANALVFTCLFKLGLFEEARRIGSKAATLNPDSEYILNNQACLQLDAKQPAAAAGLLKSLINTHGEKAQWLYNLGLAQRMVGSYQNSLAAFQRTLEIDPEHSKAAFQLADINRSLGDVEQTARLSNYVRLLRAGHAPSHSQHIHHIASHDLTTSADLQCEFQLWGDRFIPKNGRFAKADIADKKKLRIGFFVGGIPEVWWIWMAAPLINKLAEKDELLVYWNSANKITRLDAAVTVHDCYTLTDPKFARLVHDDSVDIIVDVCGMLPGSRQRPLGSRLAAKQYGWFAHNGMYASDLVSIIEDSLGSKPFCFTAPEHAYSINTPPSTLFAINTSEGLTEQTIALWASILSELSGYVLHLDTRNIDMQDAIKARFAQYKIHRQQISFDPKVEIGKGSLVLENLVNNDPLNAYLAVQKGAVVVAMEGAMFRSQQTAILLKQAGKTDWIQGNPHQYKLKVLQLIKTPMQGLTSKQLQKTGLTNLNAFAKQFRKIVSG